MDWEMIDKFTQRLWIEPGWLVRTYARNISLDWAGHQTTHNVGVGLVFVPDPFHRWKLQESGVTAS